MSKTFDHFAKLLNHSPLPQDLDPSPHGLSVVLTGTTGTLGAHLLEELATNPEISSIFCLNRSLLAEQHWHDRCVQRNISGHPERAMVEFFTVNFGIEDFGLDYSTQSKFTKSCDLIIHAAWKVDFNQDLSSFADNIKSVLTLANWSISSTTRPRIGFLSSISSVGPWNPTYNSGQGIPEAPIEDWEAAPSIGYSESKQISERLLDRAATESGIPVIILRVGQIGGSTTTTQAKWKQQELVPSMLKTSRSIGLIPADLPPVDWVPLNTISKIVTELAFYDVQSVSRTPSYYHVINPRPTPWRELIPEVEVQCGPGVRVVPLSDWVKKLRTYDATEMKEVSSKPALKMLNFFSLVASRGPTTKY